MARNSNIKAVRLSVVDYQRPPVPTFAEPTTSSATWVTYGADNKFPNALLDFYDKSATVGTIVNGFVDYILGDEVVISEKTKRFATTANRRGETLADIVRQLAFDFTLYGGFAIQVIYAKNGENIAELYALDFAKTRSNKDGDRLYYRPKGWGLGGKMLEYPAFDRKLDAKMFPSQVLYFKNGARTTYPKPMYIGALADIQTEIACSQYNLSSISRGLMARYILNFPDAGNLTDEQKQTIERGIKEKFCGADLDTNFMMYWKIGDERLEVEKLDADDQNERFITIKQDARENIYTAFRATPNLFGLPTATTGFSAQEYSQAFKLFQRTVIAPMQNSIMRVFDKIFDTAEAIAIVPFSIKFDE